MWLMVAEWKGDGRERALWTTDYRVKEGWVWPLRVRNESIFKGSPLKSLARSRTPQPRRLQGHCQM